MILSSRARRYSRQTKRIFQKVGREKAGEFTRGLYLYRENVDRRPVLHDFVAGAVGRAETWSQE